MKPTATPFCTLVPDVILDAIESLGYTCSGSFLALNSYENRVYQIGLDNTAPIIAKFYRPNRWSTESILEEHQFSLELASYEIPIITPIEVNGATLHDHADFRFAVFLREGGRALEIDNMSQLEQMGRFIGRIHAVGSARKFSHRMQINVNTYGELPYQYLLDHHYIPADLIHNFCTSVEMALKLVREHFQQAGELTQIRLHGDCHAGNVLTKDQAMHIVDLDDCLMGPAIQDIWMLLSGSDDEMKREIKHILDGYYEFYDFDPKELRLIESFRTLRMIHYAGWLAKRWEDPTFVTHFPWFNTVRYWETQLQNIREQISLLS